MSIEIVVRPASAVSVLRNQPTPPGTASQDNDAVLEWGNGPLGLAERTSVYDTFGGSGGGGSVTPVDARVVVGDQADRGVAHGQFPGDGRLRHPGHADHRAAQRGVHPRLRARGEPRPVDDDQRPAVQSGQRVRVTGDRIEPLDR